MPYLTPPGPRIAYDRDGTVGFITYWNGSVSMLDIAPAALTGLNSVRGPQFTVRSPNYLTNGTNLPWANSPAQYTYVALIFPSAIRLEGFYVFITELYSYSGATYSEKPLLLEGSTDTTNGIDGTWNVIASNVKCAGFVTNDNSRYSVGARNVEYDGSLTNIVQMSNNDTYRRKYVVDGRGFVETTGIYTRNLRGLRFKTYIADMTTAAYSVNSIPLLTIHLYGEPDTGALSDRLSFWRPDVDLTMPVGWLDWGDVPLSTTADKSFRIKNSSASLTANSIAIQVAPLSNEPTPPVYSMFTFSVDGGTTWTNSLTLAALSPGALSSEIKIRRTVPNNAALSNWSPRVTADPLSWS